MNMTVSTAPTIEPVNTTPNVARRNRMSKMRLLTSSSTISDEESKDDVDCGLMIVIEDGCLHFKLCSDRNYRKIHPNVYAPEDLEDMEALGGGGSGVAVFAAHHQQLGDIVMKHGGYKDMNELFALATIAEELKTRGEKLGSNEAALDMQRRLPQFKMIYISPFHIMDRGKKLWGHLRGLIKGWSLTGLPRMDEKRVSRVSKRKEISLTPAQTVNMLGMSIRLYEGEDKDLRFDLDADSKYPSLSVVLPKDKSKFMDQRTVEVTGDGYDSLKTVVDDLLPMMTDKLFKFTLAQKTIGGSSPKTGNQWLYEGELKGPILENLISQFIQVIKHLEAITLPEEVDVVDIVRAEVARFENDEDNIKADEISKIADTFVGNAIRKNFHPKKGRSRFLREMSLKFRESNLILTPKEVLPARHLGRLLLSGALMSDTFADAPTEPTVLQPHQHFWRNILHRAVDTRDSMSPRALRRIWTCGLADAGIHNLFVSETDLFLFDLGEPQLQSIPGFLTKFLFSFFHTLGMEEDPNNKDTWVRRFDIQGDKLVLTKETVELLPKAYDAFETCFDRLVDELLDGDRSMRWLLLQYVTLQLLSDTAFCLQRWEIKGGGQAREDNHQKGIEKWLWRALWDVYIAFDINTQESWTRLDVEHPHFRNSSIAKPRHSSAILGSHAADSLIESMRQASGITDSLRDYLDEL